MSIAPGCYAQGQCGARTQTTQEGQVRQRTRKLLGTLLLIPLILGYVVAAGAIYANYLGSAPWWALMLYFAVAGLLWFFPAAGIVRWMAKPGA
jgi:FtsH-binding integral membrane protein